MIGDAEDVVWSLLYSFGWTQPFVTVSGTKNSLCRYVRPTHFYSLRAYFRSLIVFPSLMALFLPFFFLPAIFN